MIGHLGRCAATGNRRQKRKYNECLERIFCFLHIFCIQFDFAGLVTNAAIAVNFAFDKLALRLVNYYQDHSDQNQRHQFFRNFSALKPWFQPYQHRCCRNFDFLLQQAARFYQCANI